MEAAPARRDLPIFPNFTVEDRRLSVRQWRLVRLAVFLVGLIEIALLVVVPELGLDLFYGVAVPALPALWLVAPGVWRNLCPLAAANQTPRLFGFSKGITAPAWVAEYGFLVAITLFFLLASSRKWLLNDSGPATALLLLTALAAAFLGGRYLKGKSGWCSTVCPLLPVQRLYGQNAFVRSPNSHCEPCLGCAKNCVDFNPHVAHLADVYDDDRTYQLRRRLFAAAFPGFVLGFYLVPDPPAIAIGRMYAELGLWMLLSIGLFTLIDAVARLRPGRMTTMAAATAFALYYWFTIQATADRFDLDAPAVVWALRALVIALVAVWVVRTFAKEGVFVQVVLAGTRPQVSAPTTAAAAASPIAASGAAAHGDEVVFSHPDLADVVRVLHEDEPSLLELAEANDLPIEAGCRLGVCGADPVAVVAGGEHLSPISGDEQTTLDRLGHAANTRLACVSRVRGGCQISLVPQQGQLVPAGPPPFTVASGIAHVAIVGTGIAG
ncbi:MAG TPA: 2Fe-2S iron-sulfur cluster-binding protein, partial [Euzebya sp.]|nr:2Fe-2S iron-sulfur cluster-binding protein [Euzebya sp.]